MRCRSEMPAVVTMASKRSPGRPHEPQTTAAPLANDDCKPPIGYG